MNEMEIKCDTCEVNADILNVRFIESGKYQIKRKICESCYQKLQDFLHRLKHGITLWKPRLWENNGWNKRGVR